MKILYKETRKVLLEVEGSSLREADLRGVDLRMADLRGADLYGADLEGANLYGVDLREVDLTGANLRGVSLYGADLRGTKGILSFIGEKHLLIYFKYDNTYYFKIGCMTKTSEEWLDCFEKVGKENGYTEKEVETYGDVIKLFNKKEL